MSLKFISIDFWNTIFDSSNGQERNKYRQRVLIQELDSMGCLIKQDELEAGLKATWNYFDKIWKNEMRTPAPFDSVSFLWSQFDVPFNKEAIEKIAFEFGNVMSIHQPKLIDGVKDALEALSKDFKLALVSDTGFTSGDQLRDMMKQFEIFDYFSAFSFSNETGVSKPHPKAFQIILDQLEMEAKDGLHIGDIEQTDIKGAVSIGMRGVRFSGDPYTFIENENKKETDGEADYKTWKEIVDHIYATK